jgi:Arc/MetJ-type ribon-helix-helix transcriptional regulator
MPANHARPIALTETPVVSIDAQVAKGEYASAGDPIRTAIRVLRRQDAGAVPVDSASCDSASRMRTPRIWGQV